MEVEEGDGTDDLMPKRGSSGAEPRSRRRVTHLLSFYVYLFLNALSGMNYVDSSKGVFVEIQQQNIRRGALSMKKK